MYLISYHCKQPYANIIQNPITSRDPMLNNVFHVKLCNGKHLEICSTLE